MTCWTAGWVTRLSAERYARALASMTSVDAVTGMKGRLQDYSLRAATSGKDAIGEVSMKVDFDGTLVWGKGASTDVIEASARAYLSALNRVTHPAVQRVKEIGP